jgi:hypothetical protein
MAQLLKIKTATNTVPASTTDGATQALIRYVPPCEPAHREKYGQKTRQTFNP